MFCFNMRSHQYSVRLFLLSYSRREVVGLAGVSLFMLVGPSAGEAAFAAQRALWQRTG